MEKTKKDILSFLSIGGWIDVPQAHYKENLVKAAIAWTRLNNFSRN